MREDSTKSVETSAAISKNRVKNQLAWWKFVASSNVFVQWQLLQGLWRYLVFMYSLPHWVDLLLLLAQLYRENVVSSTVPATTSQDSSQELYSVDRLHSLQTMVSSFIRESIELSKPTIFAFWTLGSVIDRIPWLLLRRFEAHYGIPLGHKKSKKTEVRKLSCTSH